MKQVHDHEDAILVVEYFYQELVDQIANLEEKVEELEDEVVGMEEERDFALSAVNDLESQLDNR